MFRSFHFLFQWMNFISGWILWKQLAYKTKNLFFISFLFKLVRSRLFPFMSGNHSKENFLFKRLSERSTLNQTSTAVGRKTCNFIMTWRKLFIKKKRYRYFYFYTVSVFTNKTVECFLNNLPRNRGNDRKRSWKK